jgi:hypothetical protein
VILALLDWGYAGCCKWTSENLVKGKFRKFPCQALLCLASVSSQGILAFSKIHIMKGLLSSRYSPPS